MANNPREVDPNEGLQEKLVQVNRVAKTVKGGRRFAFAALVVVGDGKGKIGYGTFGEKKETVAVAYFIRYP